MFDDADPENDDSLPLRELLRLAGGSCTDCRTAYSAREAVFSIALGFKAAPRCCNCLVTRLGREEGELRAQLVQYIHGRECYLKAWREAERMDGTQESEDRSQRTEDRKTKDRGRKTEDRKPEAVDAWDAGDMGCGELVMALRVRMNALPPGGVIRVTATDPAAPEDLPAWCRMTGHPLLSADHPHYLIQRKGA